MALIIWIHVYKCYINVYMYFLCTYQNYTYIMYIIFPIIECIQLYACLHITSAIYINTLHITVKYN